jgi:hypothetical protein
MPYPESCPECSGPFRNTGTHYTARRNEVGRHVLLELGCQATNRRFWWDFTTGKMSDEARSPALIKSGNGNERREVPAAVGSNGSSNGHSQGHVSVAGLDLAAPPDEDAPVSFDSAPRLEASRPEPIGADLRAEVPSALAAAMSLRDAFVRQLQLDRLTLRQMRSWVMAEEARRATEVAASATEATYERLSLILFGVDLPQLLGRAAPPPPSAGMSAEERLELQREKARIRARLRRAAIKAAKQAEG